MVEPALRIQSHKPRGYWPIKLIGHHVIPVTCRVVSCEQLRAVVSATDGCVVVISGTFDFDVIARDALLGGAIFGAALRGDFAQVLDSGQIYLNNNTLKQF